MVCEHHVALSTPTAAAKPDYNKLNNKIRSLDSPHPNDSNEPLHRTTDRRQRSDGHASNRQADGRIAVGACQIDALRAPTTTNHDQATDLLELRR
jgi:hypothetical protein